MGCFAPLFCVNYFGYLNSYVNITYNGQQHEIQFNRCTNPFCKWYAESQTRFEDVKHKPHRYRLSGSQKYEHQQIKCNPDPKDTFGVTLDCGVQPISNWSIAEEIARLASHDRVLDIEPEYEFHRENCQKEDLTPFTNPEMFYTRGESTSNSKKWQCKTCKKLTMSFLLGNVHLIIISSEMMS